MPSQPRFISLIQTLKNPLQLKQAFTLAVFLMRPQADIKSALSEINSFTSDVNRLGDESLNVNVEPIQTIHH